MKLLFKKSMLNLLKVIVQILFISLIIFMSRLVGSFKIFPDSSQDFDIKEGNEMLVIGWGKQKRKRRVKLYRKVIFQLKILLNVEKNSS